MPGAAKNLETLPGQRDGGDSADIGGEFHVGLVNHDKDTAVFAEAEKPSHVLLQDGGGGGIIWIAEDEKIVSSGFQCVAQIFHIELKIVFFLKVIVFLAAPGEGEFPGVFGVGGTKDERPFWRARLDEEGDQFAGAVSRQDKIGGDTAIT